MRVGGSRSLWIWLAIAVVAIAGIAIAFSIFRPTPPSTVVMSTGPSGSAYAQFGEAYRAYFAQNRIDLQLVESAGSIENFQRLGEPDSEIDIAFLSMGPRTQAGASGIASLGGVFFEPLWLFSGHDVTEDSLADYLVGSRFSIGPPGSASNAASRVLFELNGIDASQIDILELPPTDAAVELTSSSIDFLIISSAAATDLIRELLGNPDVTLMPFDRVDAYVAMYPALTGLVVPRGLGSLATDQPPEDIPILAFTTILAVREDLHPAIQSLLLDAATEIHSVPDMFHLSGSFPTPVSYNVALSSVAKRYYESGRPFLQRYLPFWLAVLVMQLIVAAIPLLGFLYPAVRIMPSVFDWAMRRRIFRLYAELRSLEQRASAADSPEIRDDVLNDLNRLERKARRLKVPNNFAHLAYTLRTHIGVVQGKLQS
jgi:TRAP-type uncharacterized transport system substrate-binding protein